MTPRAPPSPSARAGTRWRVVLLGGLEADDGRQRITRMPSRAVASLLARLAMAPQRAHAREELIELLWPGVDLAVGRNRLRQALSSLRSLLEPHAAPGGPALQADRTHVRVVPGAIGCDALEFEAAVRAGDTATARALYRGELMPGFYDEWIGVERARLAQLFERCEVSSSSRPAPPALRSADTAGAGAGRPAAGAGATGDADIERAVRREQVRALPQYLTRLHGAAEATQRLRDRVAADRLVTVLAPGGGGKTRLAAEAVRGWVDVAAGAEAAHPFDAVIWVPLVTCHDAASLRAAVGSALHVSARDAGDDEALAGALDLHRTLLALDNFEQLVEPAAGVVAAWLARAPRLHVLVTSRRALGLDGERIFELAPLRPPAEDEPPDDNAAVALFVDRARAVRADFRLGPRNAADVAALVRALEGLPLAIELAASRVRAVRPAEMLRSLAPRGPARAPGTARIDLLARSGPRGGADPRHASMRRAIEWSWALLTPPQARLLGALTLFPESFGAEAATAVHGASASLLLDELAGHSMLRVLPPADDAEAAGTRFAVYEPVREVAAERLAADPSAEPPRALRTRLRRWMLGWARGLPRGERLAVVALELPTLRSLLAQAADDGDAEVALALVLRLRPWLESDGMAAAELHALEAVVDEVERSLAGATGATGASGGAAAALCADGRELLAFLHLGAGQAASARRQAEAALRLAGSDAAPRARALVRKAWIELAGHHTGTPAERWLREALSLAEQEGDLETQARALHQLSIILAQERREFAAADDLLARAQALWLRLGDRNKAMARQRSRAELLLPARRWSEALAIYVECEAVARADADWVGVIDSALLQGMALAGQRRWAESARALARCTRVCLQRHHAHGLAYALRAAAWPLARLRRAEDAARLMAAADHFWTTRLGVLDGGDAAHSRRVRRLVAAQLGPARTEALWVQGAALAPGDAAALVLAAA